MDHDFRGTGRTSEQMRGAPRGAVFVWVVHSSIGYAMDLARKIGRADLEIVSPDWLINGWQGREISGLVLDHDTRLNDQQYDGLEGARTRVRPLVDGQSIERKT